MFKGFYAAASGMISQQRRQEVLTNNMANANTPGFKEDQTSIRSFPNLLMSRMDNRDRRFGSIQTLGPLSTGVYLQEAAVNQKQGPIQQTEVPTDVALLEVKVPTDANTNTKGALFFEVRNGNGEPRYTKNGSFALDQTGALTSQGFYVLDQNGQQIQLNSSDFTVREDGTVVENGATVANINIAFAANPYNLIREGDGLFAVNGGGGLPSALGNPQLDFKLKQGFLEGANVDVQKTMTDMLMAYRNFEANQKILKAYDQSMEKAVNEIGRLR